MHVFKLNSGNEYLKRMFMLGVHVIRPVGLYDDDAASYFRRRRFEFLSGCRLY
jgi:hypothetical protein